MANVKPIPTGFHSVTPHLVVTGAADAIDFYKRAFGAQELFRMPGPGGKIMHAEIKIGDSIVMLADEMPEMGGGKSPKTLNGTAVSLLIYVEHVDALFKQAISAGARERMPLQNMFWGDRYGSVSDPFEWQLATHIEDVPPEEMGKRAAAAGAGS
jgi:PhnB protein